MTRFSGLSRLEQSELVCGLLTVLFGLTGLGYFALVSLPATHGYSSPANYLFLAIIAALLGVVLWGLYLDVVRARPGGIALLLAASIGIFWFMALGVFAYGPALVPSFALSVPTFILAMVRRPADASPSAPL